MGIHKIPTKLVTILQCGYELWTMSHVGFPKTYGETLIPLTWHHVPYIKLATQSIGFKVYHPF